MFFVRDEPRWPAETLSCSPFTDSYRTFVHPACLVVRGAFTLESLGDQLVDTKEYNL